MNNCHPSQAKVPSGAVERRYKHFEWLHARLQKKYSCICVPPLPDRQVHTKYGENAADKRQIKLQQWINRCFHSHSLNAGSVDILCSLGTCCPCGTSSPTRRRISRQCAAVRLTSRTGRMESASQSETNLSVASSSSSFAKMLHARKHRTPLLSSSLIPSDKDIETFSDVVREMSAVVRVLFVRRTSLMI